MSYLEFQTFISWESLHDFITQSQELSKKFDDDISEKIKVWDSKNKNRSFISFEIFQNLYTKNDNFVSLSRKSALVMIHAQLENFLRTICKEVVNEIGLNKQLKPKPTLDDILGFTESNLKIQYGPEMNSLKDELRAFSTLRNIVIHNGGYHSDDESLRDKDEKRLSKIKGYYTENEGFVQFDDNAIEKFSRCCDLFIQQLIERLKAMEKV